MSYFYVVRSPQHRSHEVYRFRTRESRAKWIRKLDGKAVRPQNPIVRYAIKENDWTWRGPTGNKYQVTHVSRYRIKEK